MPRDTPAVQRAAHLLGFALFNLSKGKTTATETLMRKAYKELTGHEWDENPRNLEGGDK